MKKSLIVLSIVLLRISCSTFSQVQADQKIKQSGFYLGISQTSLKEESLNRALHKGPGLMGAIYLERSKGKSLKKLNLELESNMLKSDFETEISSYLISGSARFSYLRNLFNTAPGFSFNLGGNFNAGTVIEYFDNWDESHYYWITSYSFGAEVRFTYTFGNNRRIDLEAGVPVLSLVSRPPDRFLYTQSSPALTDVLKEINQDLNFLTPQAYGNFTIQLKYSPGKPKKFVPAIFWRLSDTYNNADGSGRMKCISHTIGVEYRF